MFRQNYGYKTLSYSLQKYLQCLSTLAFGFGNLRDVAAICTCVREIAPVKIAFARQRNKIMLFRKLFDRNNTQNEDSTSSSQPDGQKDSWKNYWTDAVETVETTEIIPAVEKIPENDVTAAQAEHQKVLAKMEKIASKIISAMPSLLRIHYKETAESYILKSQTGITESLGEKLSNLKADLVELDKNVADISKEKLDCNKWWWHRIEGKRNGRAIYYNRYENTFTLHNVELVLATPIKQLGNEVCFILEKYGYRCYGNNPLVNDYMKEIRAWMKDYDLMLKEEQELSKRISDAVSKRKRKQAEDLWRDA